MEVPFFVFVPAFLEARAQGRNGFTRAREALPFRIGADLGPSSIALVPRAGDASLSLFCEELASEEREQRRLQRKMERQRRAANPDNYDEQGRIKKAGKKKLSWKQSKGYKKARRRKAEHGQLMQRANEGQPLPQSFGISRARARRPESPSLPTQESACLLTRGKLKAWKDGSEPPLL